MDTTRVSAGTYCRDCGGADPRCRSSLHGVYLPPPIEHNTDRTAHSPACQAAGAYRAAATCLCAQPQPPCELGELEPPCEVCDGTGEVIDAPGRAGRLVQPCLNCDAYDRQQELLADQYNDTRED